MSSTESGTFYFAEILLIAVAVCLAATILGATVTGFKQRQRNRSVSPSIRRFFTGLILLAALPVANEISRGGEYILEPTSERGMTFWISAGLLTVFALLRFIFRR